MSSPLFVARQRTASFVSEGAQEAMGQARSEQDAMQELGPEGINSRAVTSTEDEREHGEEPLLPSEEPPRRGYS